MTTKEKESLNAAAQEMTAYKRYRVPSLERVLLILETLARTPQGLTLMELAGSLRIPKAGAFRIMVTLLHHNYVQRNETTSKITLSRKILALGNSTICQHNIIEEALPFMRSLRDDTGETVQINTHIGCEGIVLDQVPSIHEIRIVVDPGTRFGLHCTAPGKAILAFLPEKERDQIISEMTFPRHSPATITDKDEFRMELERVRRLGYGEDRAEGIVVGLHCVSACVFDQNSYPVGALTVTGLASRMPVKAFPQVAESVMKYARELSYRIGYKVMERSNGENYKRT